MDIELSEIILLAEGFSLCAHRNQRRKFEDAPYMVHPIRVARIVQEYTEDPDVIAAAMMHDVLEDTDVTADEMRRVFGDRITNLGRVARFSERFVHTLFGAGCGKAMPEVKSALALSSIVIAKHSPKRDLETGLLMEGLEKNRWVWGISPFR